MSTLSKTIYCGQRYDEGSNRYVNLIFVDDFDALGEALTEDTEMVIFGPSGIPDGWTLKELQQQLNGLAGRYVQVSVRLN